MDFYKKYLKYKKKYLLLKKKSAGFSIWRSARHGNFKKGLLFHIDKVYKKKNNNKQFVFEGNIVLSNININRHYQGKKKNVYVHLKPFRRIDDKKIQIKKFYENDNENYDGCDFNCNRQHRYFPDEI